MLSTLPGGKLFAECLIITLLVLVSEGIGGRFIRVSSSIAQSNGLTNVWVAARNNSNSSVPSRGGATDSFNLALREFGPNTAGDCHSIWPSGIGISSSQILAVAPLLRVKGGIFKPSGHSLTIITADHSYVEKSNGERSNKQKYPSTNITIVPYVCGRVVPAPLYC